MASLQLGTASMSNESWVVFGSSLKLRIGFTSKRCRLIAERWRFRVQYMRLKEHISKDELVRLAKRSESLLYILKQYGISVEKPDENKTSGRLDDLNCEDKQTIVVDDSSKMNTTDELPDLRRKDKYGETVGTAENLSGHNFSHLNTILLPVLGFCIICIIGTLHRIVFRNLKKSGGSKTSRGPRHHGSKGTRWRTALGDWDEPVTSDEHDPSSENQVGNEEPRDEVDETYSRVEVEYQRFLSECGLRES